MMSAKHHAALGIFVGCNPECKPCGLTIYIILNFQYFVKKYQLNLVQSVNLKLKTNYKNDILIVNKEKSHEKSNN